MKCPNCGSENCQYITTTETHGKGFSASNACCGSILLGPLGVLCGACGTGVHSTTHEYWVCNTCGRRFNQYEAKKVMEDEVRKIKEFVFYKEVQAKTANTDEHYETRLGEKIKEGTALYLDSVFAKEEIIKTNPVVEDKRLEAIKYGIVEALDKNELVHMIFPDERIVFAEKGIIYNNFNYGLPTQIRLYKNYVYLGQCYITMPTEQKAEALYKFIKYISTGVKTEGSDRKTDYLVLLSELQALPAEDSQKIEHFSSQPEYTEYVNTVRENSFEKFKKVDSVAYQKYEELEVKNDELMDRLTDYAKWMLCVAVGVGIVIWMKDGIASGIVAALMEVVVYIVYACYKSCRVTYEQDKYVPQYINAVVEEGKRNNYDKKGTILVRDYADIIHKTF